MKYNFHSSFASDYLYKEYSKKEVIGVIDLTNNIDYFKEDNIEFKFNPSFEYKFIYKNDK